MTLVLQDPTVILRLILLGVTILRSIWSAVSGIIFLIFAYNYAGPFFIHKDCQEECFWYAIGDLFFFFFTMIFVTNAIGIPRDIYYYNVSVTNPKLEDSQYDDVALYGSTITALT